MTQDEIKSFILSGCKYEYISYDHKKALEDYNKLDDEHKYGDMIPNCYYISPELKEKHKVIRIGKLRNIEFTRFGEMWRFKIGARYSKTYYSQDLGITVKPILSKKMDKYNLIKRGLAILEQTKK